MRPEPLLVLAALASPALASPALAEGLEGRTVLMRGETWNDPDAPLMRSQDYVGEVGPGPEFGFVPEVRGGLFVVPVLIDLSEDAVVFSYEGLPPGTFATAAFNGYVLTFPVECTLLAGARVDPTTTTLPLAPDAVEVGPQQLSVNVSGLSYGPEDRIGLRLDVTDCAVS